MTLPTDTEPSAEALAAARAALAPWVIDTREAVENSTALALDSFSAARVREERERCAAIVASESFCDSDAFDRMERNILSGDSP